MKKLCFLAMLFMLAPFLFAQSDAPEPQAQIPVKPALLVIDIQNEYLKYMSEEDKESALRLINGAIWLFRQHGHPIIRVYHSDPTYGPDPGDENFEFPSSVIIKEDDPMVVKNYPSAFKNTELEELLRKKECNTLFLCGLSAVGCVLATYYGAMERDFDVFMIKNALMSHKAQYTDFVEDVFDTVNWKTLQFMLEHMQK
ncbi:hypothetical protein AMJ87_08810 [candidate division WOR_3 bacterium SM23_60]|uniref:Isochorismatase-like domain-containing protein n=1 Tax=candidate division WOR_3 bacterium SM23_60 TaxID=1703780 RepID=A0A0S8GFP3_UNCW3|nr:MAG: hypothetical protein AMJ87_08810 [candidate division WOR_3 bacterium SM23_60]